MLPPLSSGALNRPLNGELSPRPGTTSPVPGAESAERLSPVLRGQRFPDELLFSRNPQRFNTSLNQQITAVQHASDYLGETELNLRLLARPQDQEKRQRQLIRTRQWVTRRRDLSGGTIDRNFQLSVEQPARVIFLCPALSVLLFSEQEEVITFALGEGTFRRWTSLRMIPALSLTERLIVINRALGQFRICCHYDFREQRLLFSLPEADWLLLAHWMVRGGGHCFSSDSLTLLRPEPLVSFEQRLLQLLNNESQSLPLSAEQAVRHLQQQQQKLEQQRLQVASQLISDAAGLNSLQAQTLAGHLRQQLSASRGEFRGLNQALACQANLPAAVVRQLLLAR